MTRPTGEQLADLEAALAAALRWRRRERAVSLRKLCGLIDDGLLPSGLCRMLNGETPITVRRLVALCAALDTSPGELLDQACRATLDPVARCDVAALLEPPADPVPS
ncbi:helix-turn-helix domain-containing protein [Amycolatopsis anabasis]|uniref:helix-turn-helix domain-containing protein n=1 Tax=Amycolatopsis anabasis TaxID=1840409 RepID=UPI00131CC62D|nr:helix-turn-helix domain-containing protein [Amycolatopsis anabasis]